MNFHKYGKHTYLSIALKFATIQTEPKRAEMK